MVENQTIRELAAYLDISRQALEKQIAKMDGNLLATNEKGTKIILLDGLKELSLKYPKIKDLITNKSIDDEFSEEKKEKEGGNLLATVVAQLDIKDKQITQLQKLLENQQVLTLQAQEKIKLLEESKTEEQESNYTDTYQQEEPKKQSFFAKWFK